MKDRRKKIDDELTKLFDRLVVAKQEGGKNLEDIRKSMIVRMDKEIIALRKRKELVYDVWARKEEISKQKISFIKSIIQNRIWGNLKFIISSPFIYGVFIPAMLMHAVIEIYQQVCFRIYGIPLVNPKDYFIYERRHLQYLNWFEKVNCYYCSYFNCLVSYLKEIGARTERYWCPLKYNIALKDKHSQYDKFIDDADDKGLKKKWEELRKFDK